MERSASLFLTRRGSTPQEHLSCNDMRVAIRHRISLRITLAINEPTICAECRKTFDPLGVHTLCCQKTGNHKGVHNTGRDATDRYLKRCGITPWKKDPKVAEAGEENDDDMAVIADLGFDRKNNQEAWIDLVSICPTAPTYVQNSAKDPGWCLRKVDKQKRLQYGPHARPRNALVFSLSFETGGALGPDWLALHKLVLQESAEDEGVVKKAFQRLMVDMSCAIQHGVARMTYRGYSKLLQHQPGRLEAQEWRPTSRNDPPCFGRVEDRQSTFIIKYAEHKGA